MDGHLTIHLSRTTNADGLSVTEHLLPAGFGTPFHVHRDEDEVFYILDGEFRFRQADTVRHARAGELVHLPRGVPHGVRVVSAGGGRCLILTRGGFEDMLRAASHPAPSVTLPEQREPTPEMQPRLARLCAENGIDLLGPPID